MKCKNCGREIEENDRYCLFCGTEVKEKDTVLNDFSDNSHHCENCGLIISDNDLFCKACGTRNKNYNEQYQNNQYQNNYYSDYQKEEEVNPKKPIGFFESIKLALKNTFNYKGVSTRREFWFPVLAYAIASTILGSIENWFINYLCIVITNIPYFIDGTTTLVIGIPTTIFRILCLIPGIPLVIRRLRDAGKSPYCIFYYFIPIVGDIILLIQLIKPSVKNYEL